MSELDISKNITEYRKSKELTIKELANLAGVTPSLLSQIEKGSANPSINTLKQISKALDIPVFNFFINDAGTEDLVVRKDSRKKIMFAEDDSFAYELLTPNTKGSIEFLLMKIPPKKSSSKELFSHKGEEVAYVIKGSVSLYLMNDIVELNCGDSVKIPPHSNHKWENISDIDCEIIFAVTPPSF
ncbi:helix-turn-helix domain-containing protein [Romboutsia weinsteinii]|uniref:Helix-turn-helix domain-containing protein n=1 Tax=Romboutsia weinsteinii TaxID=2020949 RepID=A0A371J766_9FIRM|nr:helix-turn-helix domain-containing protein [Romboutsia weinsteinii]RDY28507.1 helix-turn-helix domain-containing protein [Romboutsia weinsteinii]